MGKSLARLTLAAMAVVLVIGLSASPSRAHNDWGLPLVGGLAGGYRPVLPDESGEAGKAVGVRTAAAELRGPAGAGRGAAAVGRIHGRLDRESAQRAR